MKIKSLLIFIIFLSLCLIFSNVVFATSNATSTEIIPSATSTESDPQEKLKVEIEKKNQLLKDLNNQITETKTQLESTQTQKQTLQTEVKQIDSNIKQVNLGIKVSQTSIEKLGLEIEATQFDIKDSEKKINEKKQAIIESLQSLQQKEGDNFLTIFLKNNSLANSVFETQGLIDFQNQLTSDIEDLKNLKNDLGSKLKTTASKKTQKEIESSNLKNKKIIAEETKKYRQTLLEQTKNSEKLYQQSLEALQKQQYQIEDEIYKLEEDLGLRMDRSLLPSPRPGVLSLPILIASVTQKYGNTAFSAKGAYKGKPHNGLDFGAPVGTPIYAAEKGKVIAVANQDAYCPKGAYGKFVSIEHYNNLTTLYAHLSLWTVKEGDMVEKGQIIGYVGRTGFATGPHLHFGVYASQTFHIDAAHLSCGPKMPYGGTLNPSDYMDFSKLAKK
jgi:murein DD-endopeptidase MepM/ murein hydrolase activator NlpD